MAKKTTKKKTKKKIEPSVISASVLLQSESDRLKTMAQAMKGKGKNNVLSLSWAYGLSAAYLNSLNAPERIHKFKEVINNKNE